MPALNISNIKDAKLGSTDLSAVYKGSTLIWTGASDPPSVQLGNTYYKKAPSSGGCTRGNRYDLHFAGVHNIDDPGREVVCQYFEPRLGQWSPVDYEPYWSPDDFMQPGVSFDFRCFYIYQCGSSGTPSRHQGRMKFRLSDGTETEWAVSPPAFFNADDEPPEVFIDDPLNESELEDG